MADQHPPLMAIGPALQCHLCLDMVDIGILDPEEARPAVVVYPTKGSLCDWHRIKSVIGHIRLGPGESRERYRAALIDEGFLPPKRVFQDVPEFVRYAADHGKWSPNVDSTVVPWRVSDAHGLCVVEDMEGGRMVADFEFDGARRSEAEEIVAAHGREAVLTHIVTNVESGTREQVRKGLIELADENYGDCPHPLGGTTTPDRCVRCMARRFLVLLDSSVGWRQTRPSTTGDPG